MKVKVISASEPYWWYEQHIGEEFDVREDENFPQYFYLIRKFKENLKPVKHHILKIDCEIISK